MVHQHQQTEKSSKYLEDMTPVVSSIMFGLNKKYLSWSAINLWNQSKPRYRTQYYEPAKRFDNKYTRFGKEIHDRLEKDTTFLPEIDRTGLREQGIDTSLEGVPMRGFIDYIDLRLPLIRDYKTSKKQWTPKDVTKSQQLILYSLMVEKEYGISIDEVDILWIETAEKKEETKIGSVVIDSGSTLELTGHYEIVKRPELISEAEKTETLDMVVKAADEIKADYKAFLAI